MNNQHPMGLSPEEEAARASLSRAQKRRADQLFFQQNPHRRTKKKAKLRHLLRGRRPQ